ncbi:asparagine synthase-related protein [Caulobacter sp. LARHSG274]
MRDYLVIESRPGDGPAERVAAETRLLQTGQWRKVAERAAFSVYLETDRPPAYRHLPGVAGALIGDVFDAQAAREGIGRDLELTGFGTDPEFIAERLVAQAHGRYVAILSDPGGQARVLRDPLGVMEAIGWRRGGLRFVGSRLPDLRALWPADLAIDWTKIAAILRQKNLASHLCPLVGVVGFEPGVLSDPEGGGPRLWSPAELAARADRRAWPPPDPQALRCVVDAVIAAWAYGRQGVFCEISGGLDSAIVATSLARCGAPIAYGLNHSFPQAEADERAYAQRVAAAAGAPLVVVQRQTLVLTPDKLAAGAGGPRPNFVGGDPDHDADLAARLAGDDLAAMFTGRGGDAVLYQSPTPALARELLRLGTGGVGRIEGLLTLARRNHSTVWSLLARGLARQDLTVGAGVAELLSPQALAAPILQHPWLEAARGLRPARQAQILGLVNNLSAFRESRRHRAGDVIDPLLSQPVVELCLSVPTARLAIGPRDRPFARAAFADRLPPAILARSDKGNLSTFFARSLAASLETLRPYLLDGRLAGAGLLDRDRLDAILAPEQLIWTNLASEIFILLALEAWTRVWSERIDQGFADPDPGPVSDPVSGPVLDPTPAPIPTMASPPPEPGRWSGPAA